MNGELTHYISILRQHLLEQEFELGDVIGSGTFATVFKLTSKKRKLKNLAIKIQKEGSSAIEDEFDESMFYEAEIHKYLSFEGFKNGKKFVPDFLGHWLYKVANITFSLTVMERCESTVHQAFRGASQERKQQLIKGMFDCLELVRKAKVTHFDAKPNNFLVKKDEILLCDFGLAQRYVNGRSTSRFDYSFRTSKIFLEHYDIAYLQYYLRRSWNAKNINALDKRLYFSYRKQFHEKDSW